MFKSLVNQFAKVAWDMANTETESTTAGTSSVHLQDSLDEAQSIRSNVESSITFPYYPKQDTACGESCRCSWSIDIRWSDEHQSLASYATWVTEDDELVCPDCAARREEWQDVFLRTEPTDMD